MLDIKNTYFHIKKEMIKNKKKLIFFYNLNCKKFEKYLFSLSHN